MAVLKKGKYLGKYKKDTRWYYHFKPEVIAFNGEIKYVRIGNYKEEFINDRTYILSIVNNKEQKLIDEFI